MTYDLAVWEGPVPATSAEAAAEYERRMDAMESALEATGGHPPATVAIHAFVTAALARFPELDEDSGPEYPWASSPLLDEAVGDLIYFPLKFSGAEYARDVLADIAQAQGLVCYDPQIEQLLPDVNATPASVVSGEAYGAVARHLDKGLRRDPGHGWVSRLFRRHR